MSAISLVKSIKVTWKGDIANFPPRGFNFHENGLRKLDVYRSKYECPFCGLPDLMVKIGGVLCTNCHSEGEALLFPYKVEAEPEGEES